MVGAGVPRIGASRRRQVAPAGDRRRGRTDPHGPPGEGPGVRGGVPARAGHPVRAERERQTHPAARAARGPVRTPAGHRCNAEPGRQEREQAMRAEEDGEGLRALYVALTRAKCHVTAWWGRTDRTAESALHRVLFRKPGTGIPARVEVRGDLDLVARLVGADIAIEEMAARDRPSSARTARAHSEIEPLVLARA